MQCSISVEKDRASGIKMKTNGYKNPYRKEPNLDNIVDQLCTRLQDIKDKEETSRVGMPTVTLEHNEAVRRYYAAFPALKKGQESPLQYYLPPPAWCRKPAPEDHIKMQSELSMSKDWNTNKSKKLSSGKERRNSYHSQKKNRKRCNSYSRSFDSKESLPEWVTHEGVWDMETQDPVKEFIRAIALDEGYGTCENTVTDEIKEITRAKFRMNENIVPDWDDSLDLDSEWIISEDLKPKVRTPMEEELYAKFEAKFDRSLEALWAKEQNTPDDEYQELPIDFQELLSSPSDALFADAAEGGLASFTGGVWARDSPSRMADSLHDRLKPLHLADPPPPPPPPPPLAPPPPQVESIALYEGDEIYDALSSVADTMRSFTALNHSRDRSGFVEVVPRAGRTARAPPTAAIQRPPAAPRRATSRDKEDLLTSARTHFRPIRREPEPTAGRYADGDTFDIRGDLEPVEMRRSDSGGLFIGPTRYIEYRIEHTIDYSRLKLTEAQRCPDLDDPAFKLRFPLRQCDAAAQTEPAPQWGACDECGRTAKKKRSSAMAGIWSGAGGGCASCRAPPPPPAAPQDEREWEELLADISAAHQEYLRADVVEETLVSAERKRRHSAALRGAGGGGGDCSHPHARFLHCCAALDRPLTR